MNSINQKEYLKKYLSIGKDLGEKKKKKKKFLGTRLKVVDEDLDVAISQEIQDDLAAANEDAPQIVAVIDERPPSLRIDEVTKSSLWKPIGETPDEPGKKVSLKINTTFKLANKSGLLKSSAHKYQKVYSKIKEDQDVKRPDMHNRTIDANDSPSRKIKQEPMSPTSPGRSMDFSPKERLKDRDNSPPRRQNAGTSPSRKSRDSSPSKRHKTEDYSPPRRNKDNSPPRNHNLLHSRNNSPKRHKHDDNSPPRRKKDFSSPMRDKEECRSPPRRQGYGDISPPRKNRRDDLSPPRRKHQEKDNSPPRRHRSPVDYNPRTLANSTSGPNRRRNDIADTSPSRGRTRDISPPRRKNMYGSRDRSPMKDKIKKERKSPVPVARDKQKRSRWADNSPSSSGVSDKIERTLSGKKAGLQDARNITKELAALKEQEDELFRNMSADVSGANAATIVRGKKIRNLEEEALQKLKETEMKEKYDQWGKGLKQVDDQNKKLADQLHEMSKPLARYADDDDLERYLKEQEREGDPMLAYIRKKKRKKAVESGVPEKPQYMGEFMPNRFGIRPGHRWDGVDRSNGYEQKWFETQNKKRAMQEEAHKWSTEDM